jgi:hypothetical protein
LYGKPAYLSTKIIVTFKKQESRRVTVRKFSEMEHLQKKERCTRRRQSKTTKKTPMKVKRK